MKLTFLGTGGAFERTATNYHNNALLETDEGGYYLIDCSLTALESLHDLGIDPMDLEGVLLTHMHGDHDSGMEELGFRGKFLGPNQRFDLYVGPNLLPSRKDLSPDARPEPDALDLWEDRLRGGMAHIQDQAGNPVEADLETYFSPCVRHVFWLGSTRCRWIPVDHVPGSKYCYGLWMETPSHDVFYSADTRLLYDDRPRLYKEADLIFHDCMFADYYPATVHTHLEELLDLPESIQSKTMVMHYGDPAEWARLNTGALDIARPHDTFDLGLRE